MPRRSRKAASTSKKDTPEKSRRSSRRRQKSESEPDDSESERSIERKDDVKKEDTVTGNNDGSKGDESGSSDGAWQVRSENGNKGGIPKLKLCLHRPPEIPSPTSEPLASPRTRRSRRGASPQAKAGENDVGTPVETELSVDDPDPVCSAPADARYSHNVEEIVPPVSQTPEENISHDEIINEKQIGEDNLQQIAPHIDSDIVRPCLNNETEEETQKKVVVEEKIIEIKKLNSDEVHRNNEDQEIVRIAESEEKQQTPETERKRRSPSRDSSEERAKEAALKSRKTKKKDGSEDGEVVESPERDIKFPSRTGSRIKTTPVNHREVDPKNSGENATPVVRKRRWGSSASKTAKKSTLSISTDVLKEIIPEAAPIALSEVHLSPNGDATMEEGELENSEIRDGYSEERPRGSIGRKREALSDESEKDYEEEGVESGGEDMTKTRISRVEPSRHVYEPKQEGTDASPRKVAPFPKDPISAQLRQKSPSPARNSPSCVLYISNLVRPFTLVQLRELLARTGTISGDDGFWIDKIKSRCFVRYSSVEEAQTTRHALHGVRWPASNPKQLMVDFGTEASLKAALVDGLAPPAVGRDPKQFNIIKDEVKRRDAADVMRETGKDARRDDGDKARGLEREKGRLGTRKDDREKDRRVEVDRDSLKRTVRKVTIPVREWDLGKTERGFSPPPPDSNRRFNDYEKDGDDGRRHRERDRSRRSSSDEPLRKVKRKSDEAPPKMLLDELFRKTKATPAIYWLPLTAEQIAVREEMRRKHMAEHEKRIAEMRRRHEGKRRQLSGTKSRSRSPKK